MGKQLRMGGVPFRPQAQLDPDGLPIPLPEEKKEIGKLKLTIHTAYVKGVYLGRVRLEMQQNVFRTLDPSSKTLVTTWERDGFPEVTAVSEAALISAIRDQTEKVVEVFIRDYRTGNSVRGW